MIRAHWTTEYEGVGNSFGYHTHNVRARAAFLEAGGKLDEDAPVAIAVCPPHRFEPVPGKLNVLYCAWEASELPELFRERVRLADAVCVTGSFLAEPFRAILPTCVPVTWCPLGVSSDFTFVQRKKAAYAPGRGRPFRFFWNGAPNARKGAPQVIEAWRTFTEGPGERYLRSVELYLKTSQPDDAVSAKGVQRIGNVIIDDRKLPLHELVGLYHRAHCFVFPSVGEGFGLTAAEAAATGLPVIYTPTTSLLDLFDETTGFPLETEDATQEWSWKDVDARGTAMTVNVNLKVAKTEHLAKTMLEICHDPFPAFERGGRAAAKMRNDFPWSRCGHTLLGVVKGLYASESCAV